MKIYILYQNDGELDRFKKYNILKDVIYFKSHIYNQEKYKFTKIEHDIFYKQRYQLLLNKNQCNHLLSIKNILENAIKNNYDEIMILEYDVYFHKDFIKLYSKYEKIIDNNIIIHLGSSQHKWYNIITNEKIIIKNINNIEYYNNSHSLGTFAIILKKNIFLEYLNYINYVLSDYNYYPSDVILCIISKKYKSVVLYPNLIICDLSKSSIKPKNRDFDYIKFKWYKNKYII
jgi:GR25 family glycosyltransferase involved in LPS biosynthesis